MAKRKQSQEVTLSVDADYSIKDQNGKTVTLEDAKALWDAGKVADWNQAMYRLAMLHNFDVEALKAHYAKGGR